jgi:hypothetical protein
LSELGFSTSEQPFAYSALVGELGTSLGGLAALAVIVAARGASLGQHSWFAVALLVVGAALLALLGGWLAAHGVLVLPMMRREGVNLEAIRPGVTPVLWLVAHVDSKSQPVPLLVRAAGIVLLGVAWIAAIVLAIVGLSRGVAPREWLAVLVIAVVGALPVIGSVVGRRSAGAIDNASGVATVLTAASSMRAQLPIGVLITDAEELGLAGARAWCRHTKHKRGIVLNCDGVDDEGLLTLMWTRQRARDVERAFAHAAKTADQPLRVIPLVPGILVDGVAFSAAGWQAVTLSRGTANTLRRIHTESDNLEHLRGSGVEIASRVLALTASTLAERR